MTKARVFRMSIATKWYDERVACVQEYEMHFKTSRRGKIGNVRKYLAKRGVEFFQEHVYKETGQLIEKGAIRVAFEREEPTSKAERDIRIEMRRMQYRGREWKADALPSKTIPYEKKRPKRWKIDLNLKDIRRKVHTLRLRGVNYVKKWFRRFLS